MRRPLGKTLRYATCPFSVFLTGKLTVLDWVWVRAKSEDRAARRPFQVESIVQASPPFVISNLTSDTQDTLLDGELEE